MYCFESQVYITMTAWHKSLSYAMYHVVDVAAALARPAGQRRGAYINQQPSTGIGHGTCSSTHSATHQMSDNINISKAFYDCILHSVSLAVTELKHTSLQSCMQQRQANLPATMPLDCGCHQLQLFMMQT